MRIKKLEFGISRKITGAWDWAPISKDVGMCGCVIFSIGPIYFTLLGKQCLEFLTEKDGENE